MLHGTEHVGARDDPHHLGAVVHDGEAVHLVLQHHDGGLLDRRRALGNNDTLQEQ